MIGHLRAGVTEPVAPDDDRGVHLRLGIGHRGDGAVPPGQRDEGSATLRQRGACRRPGAAETEVEAARQHDFRLVCQHAGGDAVAGTLIAPRAGGSAVVEERHAVQHQVNLAGDACRRADEHPAAGVIARRPPVPVDPLLALPRPHHQRVAHHEPTGGGGPGRLEHHRARDVPALSRHPRVHRAEPEEPG
jgi:hypothetical protein